MNRMRVCSLSVLVLFAGGLVEAGNWPSWRGPGQNGVCSERDLPVSWGREQNVAWRVEMPGAAGSTPAVWGDHIFVTSVDGDALVGMALNTSGKVLWKCDLGGGNKEVRGDEGNYASPSPVTDGKHVWFMVGTGMTGCYQVDGTEVWKLDLQQRYGQFRIAFGMASTPVLVDGHLYLQLIHGDGRSETQEALVVALDGATGDEVWSQQRITGATQENEHSYASPTLYDDGQRRYLVTHGADYAIAYDLKTGDEVWRLGGLNPRDDPDRRYHPTLRFVASPVANEGVVVVPTAKNGPIFAIRGDQQGDLTGAEHLWVRDANTPDVPSPLIKDGLVYLCRENGNLLVLRARTGEELYEERTNRTRHRASPVYADGHVYLAGRDGKVTVVKAGPKFELVSQNDLGEELSASLAISNGTIYVRTFDALWAIRK